MRVEVLGGVERRRRWSRDDKMRIIEETLAPGAVVTEIARRHGIATSLVFTWRRRGRAGARHRTEFGVHRAAPGPPSDCRFGGTAPCAGAGRRGRKRPID